VRSGDDAQCFASTAVTSIGGAVIQALVGDEARKHRISGQGFSALCHIGALRKLEYNQTRLAHSQTILKNRADLPYFLQC
jgi:hypothetical protein